MGTRERAELSRPGSRPHSHALPVPISTLPVPRTSSPLSKPQKRVLQDALALVRNQRQQAEAEDAPFTPAQAWATPFGLGYFTGVVDGLCQAHGVPFDAMALAILGLVLDDTFGRPQSDRLRQRAVELMQANDADFARGRPWGGNEALGLQRGLMKPVGLVHLARGDEHRMGGPVGGPAQA